MTTRTIIRESFEDMKVDREAGAISFWLVFQLEYQCVKLLHELTLEEGKININT